MRLLIFILALTLIQCKPQKEVVKTHFVSDTLITHTTEVVTLPTKNITIIENPCKNDSLITINQTISSGRATVTIKEKEGKLVVEQQIDSSKTTNIKETSKHTEKETTKAREIQYKTPKWAWWLLIIVGVYIAYRILRVQFPFLRFLPY